MHTHTSIFPLAISKDDFLSTVDLISATLVDSGSYTPISGQLYQTVFSSAEREKLYALPHELRRTRLQEIMGMISDQEAGATTDEDLLKGEVELGSINHSPSPPPLPPRTKSTSSIKAEDLKKAEEMLKKTEQQEIFNGEDSVIDAASKLSESPKAKPKVAPRKLTKLTKSSSSSLEAAPVVDRSLKPNIPKPLKSPRKRRQHMNNTLRQMYNQDRNSASSTPMSKNAGFFTFQGKSTSQYPLGSFIEDSDSNSSDFEEFIPPLIGRRKFTSESQAPTFPPTGSLPSHTLLDRRGSSPFPTSRPQSKEYHPIKKSSPILTRRPTWFSRKMTSPALLESPVDQKVTPTSEKVQRRGQDQQAKASRKKKGRSRSLDTRTNMSVGPSGNTYSLLDLHVVGVDSDENTGGTVDSSGYARPFEHINSWRKLIGMDDGSAFSGSLPHLADNVSSAINNDDDSDAEACTYLDPREIAQKLDKNMPQKVRKRLDTVISNTYLQLISVQPPQFAEFPVIQPPNVIAATPVEPSNTKQLPANSGEASFKEKWENRSLDFIERPDSCLSGYTSDALSDASSADRDADRSDPDTEDGGIDERIVNPYDEIRTGSNNSYSTAAEALRTR